MQMDNTAVAGTCSVLCRGLTSS